MPLNDDLGKRMKEFYEQVPKARLMRRTPVAIRIDGKAFHTFTRGFQKPFDKVLVKSMQETMKYLCENIQGCVLGYTQSDEITLILVDYKRLNSSAWFDYEVQKMCSIAASMATMAFNRAFEKNVDEYSRMFDALGARCAQYRTALHRGAMFDARVFNIPREEVTNLVYWRQLDATRNSIQMVGQANFSHKELQNKSCNEIQDMLHEERGINWNDFPAYLKRGSCCIKKWLEDTIEDKNITFIRPYWVIDNEIPIFKDKGREYIECLIQPEE